MAGPRPSRYSRQILLPQIGGDGQERIRASCVSVVGLGAIGGVLAAYLARAGVGTLRLIDRDTVEDHNLQRQLLYSERDAAEGLPKAVAARRHLAAVNSQIRIAAIPEHLGSGNAAEILAGSSLIVDGTDNLETRFLLNDYSVKEGIPWIYGACVGTEGLVAAILPGRTPCLRCFIAPAPAGLEPTCDTAGILGPVAGIVGSVQAARALQILAGREVDVPPGVLRLEAWSGVFSAALKQARPDPSCPACALRRFEFLEGGEASSAQVLCGRGAVQITSPRAGLRDLDEAEKRLREFGDVVRNRFLLKARIEGYTLSVFPDGRVIVGGTTDADRARSLVDRYLGGA